MVDARPEHRPALSAAGKARAAFLVSLLAGHLLAVTPFGSATMEHAGGPPEPWSPPRTVEDALTILATQMAPRLDSASWNERLAAVQSLTPEHRELLRIALEGHAVARDHQDHAWRDLSAAQQRQLAATHPLDTSEQRNALVSRLDGQAAIDGAIALLNAAEAIHDVAALGNRPSAARNLAEGLDREPLAAPSTPEALHTLLGVTEDELTEIPAQVKPALASVVAAAMDPARHDAPEEALLKMAAAVDNARQPLENWRMRALAEHVHAATSAQPLSIPNPNAPHLNLPGEAPPRTTETDLRETMEQAAEVLGTYLDATPDSWMHLEQLAPEHRRALATFYASVVTLQEASATLDHILLAYPAPTATDLQLWMQGGDPSGLAEAEHLLQAIVDEQLAHAQFLGSITDLQIAFANAAPVCAQDAVVVLPLLALDPCGVDSVWEEQALLNLDVGGDDRHAHRAGGAPFVASNDPEVWLPISVLLDLGGNDTYDAAGEQCAQGAACNHLGSSGPTGSRRLVGILVDWAGNDTENLNGFAAGDRSQGHAAGHPNDPPGPSTSRYRSEYGLLVERVGARGTLNSNYQAGNYSQASATLPGDYQGGTAILMRLIGAGGRGESSFSAGSNSQGSQPRWTPGQQDSRHSAIGWFLNVAAEDSEQHDSYKAGSRSQGASNISAPGSLAAFVDVAGPRSVSHDSYMAGTGSRGAANSTAAAGEISAIFIDAVVHDPGHVRSTGNTTAQQLEVNVTQSHSDDAYDVTAEGTGYGGGFFLDVNGEDSYDDPQIGNDQTWSKPDLRLNPTGVDSAIFDSDDEDPLPSVIEEAWHDFVSLWNASDADDSTPTPYPVRVFVDAVGSPLHLNDDYALVVSLGGDDTYGPLFTAGLHVDLRGDDHYQGRVGSASAVPRDYAGDRSRAVYSSVPEIIQTTANDTLPASIASVDDPTQDGPDPGPRTRLISIAVDFDGNDVYSTSLEDAHGFGAGHGVGVLLDLGGDDVYEAPRNAQGVAIDGGLGALLDLGPDSTNTFRAQPLAHGMTAGNGSFALLLATGSHNRFNDGGVAGETIHRSSSGAGASLNVDSDRQDNQGPSIALLEAPDQIVAGVPHEYVLSVADPEGDDLDVCLVFSGQVPLQEHCVRSPATDARRPRQMNIWHALDLVPTGPETPGPLDVTLNVKATDSGTRESPPLSVQMQASNTPPVILESVRGPRSSAIEGGSTPLLAYQIPVAPAADLAPGTVQVDWGDGAGSIPEPRHLIDWASSEHGGRAAMDTFNANSRTCGPYLGHRAVDGDHETAARLNFGAQCPRPALLVELPGARTVEEILLNMSIDGSWIKAPVAIEGFDQNGTLHHLAQVNVTTHEKSVHFATPGQTIHLPLAREMDLTHVIVRVGRQTLVNDEATAQLLVYSAEVRGPAVLHQFAAAGTYHPTFTVIDDHGGFNRTQLLTDPIVVSSGDAAEFPFDYVTLSSRGPARVASVAANTTYSLVMKALSAAASAGQLCVAWGDGTASDCLSPSPGQYHAFPHAWNSTGSHLVRATYTPPGESATSTHVVNVTVEDQLVDLFVADTDLVAAAPSTHAVVPRTHPIALVAPGNHATHHSGSPYPVRIDVAGNDRYTGAVAASWDSLIWSHSTQTQNAPLQTIHRPTLVVDLAGDDDHLSTDSGSQAFAAYGSMAVLLDASGDDHYTSNNHSQGAGVGNGAAILADLAGDDVFNGLTMLHPLVAKGMASHPSPWTDRPGVMGEPGIRPLMGPDNRHHVQGAGNDGFGALLLHGGADVLVAGAYAQGAGGHRLGTLNEYAVPDPSCANAAIPDTQAPFDSMPLCSVGLRDWQSSEFLLGSSVPQDTSRFEGFLEERERYGPGVGVLVSESGVTAAIAQEVAQGAGGPSGRGIYDDEDGGSWNQASRHSQGTGFVGQGIYSSRGPVVLTAHESSQGAADASFVTPSPEPGRVTEGELRLPVAMSQLRCGTGCGSATDQDSRPGIVPTIAWLASNPSTIGNANATLQLLTTAGNAADIETVVIGHVRAWNASGTCEPPEVSPTVAGPMILLHHVGVPATLDVLVNPSAQWWDGPFVQPGCLQLTAFSRHVDHEGRQPWTASTTSATVLANPTLTAAARRVVDGGASFALELQAGAGVANLTPPSARFGLIPTGGSLPPTSSATGTGSWTSGETPTLRVNLPSSLATSGDGAYQVAYATAWTFGAPAPLDWRLVPDFQLVVDNGAPYLSNVVFPSVAKPLEPVHGTGVALDTTGVAGVELRLTQSGRTIALASGATSLATLADPGVNATAWTATLQPTHQFVDDARFDGGPVRIEARTTDIGNLMSGWQPIGDLLIDAAAPILRDVAAGESGRSATNQSHPIPIEVSLDDSWLTGCVTSCPHGSGVATNRTVMLLQRPDGTIESLPVIQVDETAGQFSAVFNWTGTGEPPEGNYSLILSSADAAGNVQILNPGPAIIVDRSPPSVQNIRTSADGRFARVGENLLVTVDAVDVGRPASGIHAATVHLGDREATMAQPAEGGDERYATILVPEPAAGSHALPLTIRLEDNAGNTASVTIQLGVVSANAGVTQESLEARHDRLTLILRTENPSSVTAAEATNFAHASTGHVVRSDALEHEILFPNLRAASSYDLYVQVKDASGHEHPWQGHGTTRAINVGAVAWTPEKSDSVYSGHANIVATYSQAVPAPGWLSLHHSGNGSLIDSKAAAQQLTGDVTLTIDTSMWSQPTDVPLTIRFDNGAVVREEDIVIRVDNEPPTGSLQIRSGEPRGIWYNQSVSIVPSGNDPSGPVTFAFSDNGVDYHPSPFANFSSDGIHNISVHIRDAAIPPNFLELTQVVRIDRTAPVVAVTTPVANRITSAPNATLNWTVFEATSGVESYRIHNGSNWSAWMAQAPGDWMLPAQDGDVLLVAEVRDAAGNIGRRTVPATVDRTPPVVHHVQWSLYGNGLFVAASDTHNESKASGVQAIRFGNETMPTDWASFEGLGLVGPPAMNPASHLQLRDAAGNLGSWIPIPNSTPEFNATPLPPTAAGDTYLLNSSMEPDTGDTTTSFRHRIDVRPFNESAPTAVWLERDDGTRFEMHAVGGAFEVEVNHPATRIARPAQHRFVAAYDGVEITSPWTPNPLVIQALPAPVDSHDAPTGWLTLVLVGIFLLRRPRP